MINAEAATGSQVPHKQGVQPLLTLPAGAEISMLRRSPSRGISNYGTAHPSGRPPMTDARREAIHSTGRAGILDDGAEQFPAFAVQLHHLQLLVDPIIVRRGVADDPGQREV